MVPADPSAEGYQEGDMVETWDLPFEAQLCFAWDFVYVATPDQLETAEEMSWKWLCRNRWKLQPDGSMTGTPLRLELDDEQRRDIEEDLAEVDRKERKGAVDAALWGSAEAEVEAAREAMEQEERDVIDGDDVHERSSDAEFA